MKTQLRLEAFYTFNERFAKVRSKRIKKAVKGITGNQSTELLDGSVQPVSKARKRRRVSPIQPGANRSEKVLRGTDNDVARKDSISINTLSHKQSGEGEVNAKLTPSREGKARAVGRGVGGGSSGNRNRGRGRRQQVGRGRRKGSPVFYSAKSSSSDGDSSNNEQQVHAEKLEEPRELRRVNLNILHSHVLYESVSHFFGSSYNYCKFIVTSIIESSCKIQNQTKPS